MASLSVDGTHLVRSTLMIPATLDTSSAQNECEGVRIAPAVPGVLKAGWSGMCNRADYAKPHCHRVEPGTYFPSESGAYRPWRRNICDA